MTNCVDFGPMIQLVLDKELTGRELERAHAHLKTCEACSERLAEEARLSQLLRRSYIPLVVPTSLRDRIQSILTSSSLKEEPARQPPATASIFLVRSGLSSIGKSRNWLLPVAASILVLIGFFLFSFSQNRLRADSFIDAAIAEDHSLTAHIIPLDVTSTSAQEVTDWFTGRVPFQFRLPNAGIASDDNAKYTLAGGRLVSFRGQRAALIDFHFYNERMSLLIASDRLAKASGGNVTVSDGIVIHRKQWKEHNVATWENMGLTYALVFARTAPRNRPCSTCHMNSTEDGRAVTNQSWLRQLHSSEREISQSDPRQYLRAVPGAAADDLHSGKTHSTGDTSTESSLSANSESIQKQTVTSF